MPNYLDNIDVIDSNGTTTNVLIQDRGTLALANQIASNLASEITNRENAVTHEAELRANADTALQNSITNITNSLANNKFYNVANYGITGDGTTDVTDAINNLIDDVDDGSTIYFPAGTYLVREVKDSSVSGAGLQTNQLYEASLGIHLQNRNSITIMGCGKDTIIKGINPAGCMYGNIINIENCNGIIIKDLTVYGNLQNHVNVCQTGNMKDEWLYGINFWKNSKNCLVDNVRCEQCHADGINLHDDFQRYMINIHIRDCTFYYCGRNGIQCGKSKITFIDNCTFDHMTGAQTTGCAIDCEAHDYVTEDIYINNCTWTNTRQGVAFNTIKNAIVSDCYGDTFWNQSRKVYHSETFDRGFGVIFDNVHGCSSAYITDGTEMHGCDIERLSVYSNLDRSQSNDIAIIDGCNIDVMVFYGNFDGNMLITNNVIDYLDIEPGYTVSGLNIIGNRLKKLTMRMSGELNIIGNVIIGNYDTDYAIRTLGTGTHKLVNNTIKIGNSTTNQQINLVGDKIVIAGNTIEDTKGSGVAMVGTAPTLDVINNYIDASGCSYAIQLVCSGTLLADGNITKSVNGITISSGTNQTGVVNRNYNI